MPQTFPIDEAFLLAAGLGTRMKPITDTIPKPLVQVAGVTLLDHALNALDKGGVNHTVVNVHYLADQIEAHCAKRTAPRITISDERAELLDSGGGVVNGLNHFASDTIFVLNADSFWVDNSRSNLTMLRDTWDPERMDMLMLLAERESAIGFDGPGDFFQNDAGQLTRRGEAETAPFAYAGAFIVKTELFDGIAEPAFSLNRQFDDALSRGRLFGQVLDGLWLHVGTPDAIPEAEAAIARTQAA
ncbi:nucleotidyltransferase family protein [Pseudahrensia aquimaris]|uniref:Nucleotidyltransferase family protein n=1 Tax=Pseudahrensia aquimaris TaxID=744461 RepID=A0ABW3FGQ8_9HYPH